MIVHRRRFIAASAGFAAASALCRPAIAQAKKLYFGVRPLLPSPDDTKKAYAPVFAHLAKELGADFDLVSTTDWAGMAVAMGSGPARCRLDGSLGVRDRQFRDQLPGRCHREV